MGKAKPEGSRRIKFTENHSPGPRIVGPNANDSQVSYGDFGEEFVVPFGTKVSCGLFT